MPASSDGNPAAHIDARSQPLHNLWRLRPYLRPYAMEFAWLLVAARGAPPASLALPRGVDGVVDGAGGPHHQGRNEQRGGGE
ncbi:ABC transporter ATP-binding protein, partial [Micromonospora sp. NPDC005222]